MISDVIYYTKKKMFGTMYIYGDYTNTKMNNIIEFTSQPAIDDI